jgi:hypothetical protein
MTSRWHVTPGTYQPLRGSEQIAVVEAEHREHAVVELVISPNIGQHFFGPLLSDPLTEVVPLTERSLCGSGFAGYERRDQRGQTELNRIQHLTSQRAGSGRPGACTRAPSCAGVNGFGAATQNCR